MLGGLVIRITYGGVVIVMCLYSLGQCPELNFRHQLNLLILLRFKSFCPTLAWLGCPRQQQLTVGVYADVFNLR